MIICIVVLSDSHATLCEAHTQRQRERERERERERARERPSFGLFNFVVVVWFALVLGDTGYIKE